VSAPSPAAVKNNVCDEQNNKARRRSRGNRNRDCKIQDINENSTQKISQEDTVKKALKVHTTAKENKDDKADRNHESKRPRVDSSQRSLQEKKEEDVTENVIVPAINAIAKTMEVPSSSVKHGEEEEPRRRRRGGRNRNRRERNNLEGIIKYPSGKSEVAEVGASLTEANEPVRISSSAPSTSIEPSTTEALKAVSSMSGSVVTTSQSQVSEDEMLDISKKKIFEENNKVSVEEPFTGNSSSTTKKKKIEVSNSPSTVEDLEIILVAAGLTMAKTDPKKLRTVQKKNTNLVVPNLEIEQKILTAQPSEETLMQIETKKPIRID
jgi:ribonuclease E